MDVEREAAEACLDVSLVRQYGSMDDARTKTGRRPNQRVFRERLAHPYSLGRLESPVVEAVVIDSNDYFKSPDSDVWRPLLGLRLGNRRDDIEAARQAAEEVARA